MRTTVTLDADVESRLRKEVHRRGQPFKEVLNDAVRTGLRAMQQHDKAFEPITFNMGRPRVDLTEAAARAAELEDDEILGRFRRTR